MTRSLRALLFLGLVLCVPVANATYHTYQIDEIYSNADGTVQYVVLHEAAGMDGQNQQMGQRLTSTGPGGTATFVFPNDLPGGGCSYYGCSAAPTARTRMLIATHGFVALGLIAPDFVIPDGFLPIAGGTLNYAGFDQWTFGPLPVDGTNALFRNGSTTTNVATNFSGSATTLTLPGPTPNYQGLWWNASESGWGINFAHSGDQMFATWYTYDTSGKAWWLSMLANRTTGNTYAGEINVDSGPPFNNFVGAGVKTMVGNGTLTFADANNGSFSYTVNGVPGSKAITRYDLGTGPQPTCTYAAATPNFAAATNYQDLWWVANGAEDGWGVNFAHQGDSLFATWYTYNADHTPLWLSALVGRGLATSIPGRSIRVRDRVSTPTTPPSGQPIPWAPPPSPSPMATMRLSGTW